VLRRARTEPETLFLALDADARAMSDASRRAARASRKGGLGNVIFLAAAVDELPGHLRAIADEATIALPWGSLLAAVLDPAGSAMSGLRGVLKPCGELSVLVSAQDRDNISATSDLDTGAACELACAYENAGYNIVEVRPATRADVELLSSGWGRRLGIPERRAAWLLRLRVS